VDCSLDALREWLTGVTPIVGSGQLVPRNNLLRLSVTVHLKRRGMEAKLIVDRDGVRPITSPDPALIKAVAKAHTWNQKLIAGEARSVRALARDASVTNRYVRKLLPLAFLAPDIIEAVTYSAVPHGAPKEGLLASIVFAADRICRDLQLAPPDPGHVDQAWVGEIPINFEAKLQKLGYPDITFYLIEQREFLKYVEDTVRASFGSS